MAKPAGGHFGFGDGLLRAVFFGFGFGFGFTVALAVAAGVALTVGLAVGLAVTFIVLLAVGVGFFVSASALLDDAIRAMATKRANFFTGVPT
jgi:apolipoprotein N-acyltransferase